MKKQLLLAMAVASFATVSAQQTVKVSRQNRADIVATPVVDAAIAPVESVASASAKAVVNAPTLVDGDFKPIPFYTVDGLFYDNIIVSKELYGYVYNGLFGYLPPFAEIQYDGGHSSYTGTFDANATWAWKAAEISTVNIAEESVRYDDRTGEGMKYNTGFKTKYVPFAISLPTTLSLNDVEYSVGNTFTSNGTTYTAAGFQYGGRRGNVDEDAEEGFTEVALSYYPMAVRQGYNAITSPYAVCNSLRVSNWILGKPFFSDVDAGMSVAQPLNPSPYGVYGFDKVYLRAYVNGLAPGGKFKVDIYQAINNEDNATQVEELTLVGKKLASGYVATDGYTTAGVQFVEIPIIDIEGEGEDAIENPTFFNVTEPVAVVVSLESASGANDEVLPIPVFAGGFNTSVMWNFRGGLVFFDSFPGMEGPAFYPRSRSLSTIGGVNLMQLGWDMLFSLQYSYLYNDGVYPELSYDAPAAGGEQKFTFTPAEDLYNAKITVSDNQDWVFVYPVADLAADGTQELVVEVEELPAGVSGRSALVTVEIEGAIQTIAVKQGDTSGIDTIEGDKADVVSSQIFDLQGRQLNAVPENGLYIRRDVKADNTVTTTKVVK